MGEAKIFSGQCLCAAVSITIEHEKPAMSACHCSICRQWTGGPFMAVDSHQTPTITGEQHIATYASSEWAERSFCRHCGTHLFYRLKQGGFYAISVGLFPQSAHWPLEMQVFIDEKPQNYSFAESTPVMTGQEVFNAWSPS